MEGGEPPAGGGVRGREGSGGSGGREGGQGQALVSIHQRGPGNLGLGSRGLSPPAPGLLLGTLPLRVLQCLPPPDLSQSFPDLHQPGTQGAVAAQALTGLPQPPHPGLRKAPQAGVQKREVPLIQGLHLVLGTVELPGGCEAERVVQQAGVQQPCLAAHPPPAFPSQGPGSTAATASARSPAAVGGPAPAAAPAAGSVWHAHSAPCGPAGMPPRPVRRPP